MADERRQTLSASTLMNDSVINPEGEDLGDIEDFMIDVDNGRIAYCVLSFGGIMGIGDKLFAVPWDALRVDEDRKCFILDVDKERLKEAPGFDQDNWPDWSNQQWVSRVREFYGVEVRR